MNWGLGALVAMIQLGFAVWIQPRVGRTIASAPACGLARGTLALAWRYYQRLNSCADLSADARIQVLEAESEIYGAKYLGSVKCFRPCAVGLRPNASLGFARWPDRSRRVAARALARLTRLARSGALTAFLRPRR